jgi:predicted negative regulator of RcsB-dependent stress response
MNERTQVLIFVILAFTALFGMIGWSVWDYKQLKKNKGK